MRGRGRPRGHRGPVGGRETVNEFREIIERAIEEAEKVDCSLQDFYYGLDEMIAELRARRAVASDEECD